MSLLSAVCVDDPGDHLEIRFARSLIDPHELTRQLVALHGARIVSQLAGYSDPKIAYRWSRPTGSVPGDEALRRLYAAHRIWLELRGGRSHDQAIAWLLAPHPQLAEQQPLQLMIQGQFSAVAAAVAAVPPLPLRRSGSHSSARVAVGPIAARWHEATLVPMRDVVTVITTRFGARAAAAIAGEPNPKVAYRWIRNEGKLPSGEAARRLYAMYRVILALDEFVPDPVARAWFLAANPSLSERSPLDAAREGSFQAIARAADQFLLALYRARSPR